MTAPFWPVATRLRHRLGATARVAAVEWRCKVKKDKFQRNELRDAVDSLLLTGAVIAIVFAGAVCAYGIAATAGLKL